MNVRRLIGKDKNLVKESSDSIRIALVEKRKERDEIAMGFGF